MSEEDLDGADVGAGLEEVSGEAVAKGVNGDVLADVRAQPLAGELPLRRRGQRPVGMPLLVEIPGRQRVVRADGSLAQGERQRSLLEDEGVEFRGSRVDMRAARMADLG